jgi:hypothetical protein
LKFGRHDRLEALEAYPTTVKQPNQHPLAAVNYNTSKRVARWSVNNSKTGRYRDAADSTHREIWFRCAFTP